MVGEAPRRLATAVFALAAVVLLTGRPASLTPAGEPRVGGTPHVQGLRPGTPYRWQLPPGFPVPRVPQNNPMTEEKVELGRHLFHDRRLSGNGTSSCATCHRPELAFTDGAARSTGSTGELHPRGAMSLANVAYGVSFGWDDPDIRSLERQARVPMFNQEPVELGLTGHWKEAVRRLRSDPETRRRFHAAFPGEPDPITLHNVTRALACFERTLISGRSPYDRLLRDDDRQALSPAARRGMRLFFSEELACSSCHGGFVFAEPADHTERPRPRPEMHNTGLYNLDGQGAYPPSSTGRHRHTRRPAHMGHFKAPTLRNIELTAPYMHDGSVATLEEAVAHYARGGRRIETGERAGDGAQSPLRDERIRGFELAPGQRADLVEFLKSLTDRAFVTDPRFAAP